jgi:hypothetical protein
MLHELPGTGLTILLVTPIGQTFLEDPFGVLHAHRFTVRGLEALTVAAAL